MTDNTQVAMQQTQQTQLQQLFNKQAVLTDTMSNLGFDQKEMFNILANSQGLGEVRATEKTNDLTFNLAGLQFEEKEITNPDTGEIHNAVVVTMITDGKQGIYTASDKVVKDMRDIVRVFGLPNTWKTALNITIAKKPYGGGKNLNVVVIN